MNNLQLECSWLQLSGDEETTMAEVERCPSKRKIQRAKKYGGTTGLELVTSAVTHAAIRGGSHVLGLRWAHSSIGCSVGLIIHGPLFISCENL